jgi:hypothetical protein
MLVSVAAVLPSTDFADVTIKFANKFLLEHRRQWQKQNLHAPPFLTQPTLCFHRLMVNIFDAPNIDGETQRAGGYRRMHSEIVR